VAEVRVPGATGLVPGLTNISKIGVVTTYGAPRHVALIVGDGGNALLGRTLLPLYAPSCAVSWLGLWDMNGSSREQREAFVERVRDEYEHRFL
jgi:hypothetical protein